MRFNSLSSFASGILLATTICGAAYFTVDGGSSKAADKKTKTETTVSEISEEEMKEKLETSGYIVQTSTEYDINIEEAQAAAKKENEAKESSDDDKKVVHRAVFNVTEGMTSIDVGKILVEAKIIDDAFKFSKDVEKKGVENRLRPGLYKVDSEMSYKKVISTIFS